MILSTYQWIGLIFAIVGLLTLFTTFWESKKNRSTKLTKLPLSRMFIILTRLMVGTLFIYSGFVKANDYIGFAYKLDEYFTVFAQHFPPLAGFFEIFIPWAEPMAWFISVFEIALGVALILGWQANLAIWLSILMMVFFTVLTGYSHVTGAVTDCGCFGDALKLAPWESFMKDIILTTMLIPLFWVRKSIRPFPTEKMAMMITLASFLISGIFSYYCHEYLPVVDYRPYKIGTDLAKCTTIPGPDGFPKCKDWDILFRNVVEEPQLFEGNKLLIVAYDLEKADQEALKESAKLAEDLALIDIEAIGLTASFGEVIEKARSEHQINYPFGLADATVLKTIIRSNPGYVMLKDGVILDKWHYNQTPSAADIQNLIK